MKRFKINERDTVKLGKTYLKGGLVFISIAMIILVFSIIWLKSSLNSMIQNPGSPSVIGLGLLPITIMIASFFFGYFYFFWGLYKIRNVIKDISNIYLIYYGIISYTTFLPTFLIGLLNSIFCTSLSGCKWNFSHLQLLTITLGFILLFSSIVSVMYELHKIKGDPLESYYLEQEQMKRSTITPISKALYRIRVEKIEGDLEKSNLICGKCGEPNRFKSLDEKSDYLQCIKCGSENYLAQ